MDTMNKKIELLKRAKRVNFVFEKMDSEIKREIDDGIIQSPMAQVSEEKK